MSKTATKDYSLVGENSRTALEKGLVDAAWYTSPVPKEEMRKLLKRKDGPAIANTLLWFGSLFGFGYWGYLWFPSLWCIIPFAVYGVLYASACDSRWHECGHGTAFKTDWMNNFVYQIASFMEMREPTLWRWSHSRHHSDTIIVGRDPEIVVPNPPKLKTFFISYFGIPLFIGYFKSIAFHAMGKLTENEKNFIPEAEQRRVAIDARVHAAIYLVVILIVASSKSILPILYIGLPTFYGVWFVHLYGYTQHVGLAENVLDHRLNCRTVYMNPISRFLCMNMNYHVEHHMFPLVPFFALPKLHQLIKDDCPTPYKSTLEAYQEIIPTLFRQVKDPAYCIKRKIPDPQPNAQNVPMASAYTSKDRPVNDGWIDVCEKSMLAKEDVLRFDHNQRTYAIYRTADDHYYATDGICTHGNAHLADGLVKGNIIECAKHNGRFDIRDGSPQRKPVCVHLKTYAVKEESGNIWFSLENITKQTEKTHEFRVISNENVATFIKELILEPVGNSSFSYKPGDYLQLDIPPYQEKSLSDIEVIEPYATVWRQQHVFDNKARNEVAARRNYSLAGNPDKDKNLFFNVRIATPPRGQDCPAGSGSTYVHSLKAGDCVTAVGPFGDFHIKDSNKEMVYLGGGAGMAPLRSHLSYLLETLKTKRRITFWYGARSLQELYYREYFEKLEQAFENFSFHFALSEPLPGEDGFSHTGFIHDVLKKEYLHHHPDPKAIEYYLCGPPAMMQAATTMLKEFEVDLDQIAYDEF